MTGAFGAAADLHEVGRVWCNLCRAEGDTFEIARSEDEMDVMQRHSLMRHPEHEAALRAGQRYEPVEVMP